MFGWKGSPRLFYHLHVPSADIPIVYELMVSPAVISCVVGFTHREKVWSQVPSHYLASIYKYVSGKKSKCKHSCKKVKNDKQQLFANTEAGINEVTNYYA